MSKYLQLRDKYINLLYQYCNTYDSEAISQVLMASAAHKIEMSDVYTELNVISRQEYEEKIGTNASESVSNIDIDKMILDIDRKIYELTIEELKERTHFFVEDETLLKIKVLDVMRVDRKDYPVVIKEELLQFSILCDVNENVDGNVIIKKMMVQIDSRYVEKMLKEEWCHIKGHYVTYKDFRYFVMEPCVELDFNWLEGTTLYNENINIAKNRTDEEQIYGETIRKSTIQKIDKEIYKLTVDELKDDEKFSVSPANLIYLKVIGIEKTEKKDYPIEIREDLLLFTVLVKESNEIEDGLKKIFVQVDKTYATELLERDWCWVKGHYVRCYDFEYFVMEPYFEKKAGSSENMDAECYITGEVILGEPGGGKTTLLIKKVIEYCEKYLGCEENIKSNAVFPILISTREIKKEELYDDNVSSLKSVIIAAIESVFKRDSDYDVNENQAIHLYNNLVAEEMKVVLIIDGFEELVKLDINQEGAAEYRDDGVRLLDLLEKTYKEEKISISYLVISSRYKEYGYQRLKDFVRKHDIDEFFICELRYDETRIIEFANRWFKVFKKINPLIDVGVETDRFKKIYRDNPSIRNIINTPIELTSLIMLYITSYSLPTDISILYRNVIEVWLTFNVIKADFDNFSLEDIMMELSRVALYMACTEDEKILIKKESLKNVIDNTKMYFQRYYRSNAYCNVPTERIINYIVRRNIMIENDGKYEFKHRQYQAFLCANCIIGNYIAKGENDIIGETRRLDRMMYFKKHLDSCDQFWQQILIFSAFMSVDLHDSIISELLERSQGDENNNYYIGILIQLVNSQGFWFETSELELIYDELFKNPTRWRLFTGYDNTTEIKRMLINGRKENNNAFLRKGMLRYNELKGLEKTNTVENGLAEKFKDKFCAFFFYVIWRCPVSYELYPEVFRTFFANEIRFDIMSEVYSKHKEGYDKDRLSEIKALGEIYKAERDDKQPVDYMIISFILGYNENLHPIETARDYFKENDRNSELVALDIMFIAAWIIYSDKEKKYGYEVDDYIYKHVLKECLDYVVAGLMKKDDVRDYKLVYREWSIANYTLKKRYNTNNIMWYTEEIFKHYTELCGEKEKAWCADRDRLDYDFEVVASFPFDEKYSYGVCEGRWSEKVLNELFQINYKTNDPELALFTFKLLIFAGAIPIEDITSRYVVLKGKIRSKITYSHLVEYSDSYKAQLIELGLLVECPM